MATLVAWRATHGRLAGYPGRLTGYPGRLTGYPGRLTGAARGLYEATQAGGREERQNGRFAGLSTFDWCKLLSWRLEGLKTKKRVKF